MTSIKPPSVGSPVDRPGSASSPLDGPGRAGPSFRDVLGPEATGGAASAQDVGQARVAADPASLVEALRAGMLTPEQALDRLVDQVVGKAGTTLTEAQQSELRSVLLEAL